MLIRQLLDEFKQVYCSRCVDTTFALFESQEIFNKFWYYSSKCHTGINFLLHKKGMEIFVINVEVSHEQNKVNSTVDQNHTFGGICVHFDSFFSSRFNLV